MLSVRYAGEQRQTTKHTDTIVAIPRTPTEGEIKQVVGPIEFGFLNCKVAPRAVVWLQLKACSHFTAHGLD